MNRKFGEFTGSETQQQYGADGHIGHCETEPKPSCLVIGKPADRTASDWSDLRGDICPGDNTGAVPGQWLSLRATAGDGMRARAVQAKMNPSVRNENAKQKTEPGWDFGGAGGQQQTGGQQSVPGDPLQRHLQAEHAEDLQAGYAEDLQAGYAEDLQAGHLGKLVLTVLRALSCHSAA